jgi:hypothetical protein
MKQNSPGASTVPGFLNYTDEIIMVRIATKKEDVTKEIDGAWIQYQDDGSRLLIARMGNPKNRKAYDRAQGRFKGKARKNRLTPDDRIEITSRCLAASILLDWEGINDMDGKPLEYSEEMAYMALRWDLDLREFVAEQADISENFRALEVTKTGKK